MNCNYPGECEREKGKAGRKKKQNCYHTSKSAGRQKWKKKKKAESKKLKRGEIKSSMRKVIEKGSAENYTENILAFFFYTDTYNFVLFCSIS